MVVKVVIVVVDVGLVGVGFGAVANEHTETNKTRCG